MEKKYNIFESQTSVSSNSLSKVSSICILTLQIQKISGMYMYMYIPDIHSACYVYLKIKWNLFIPSFFISGSFPFD